MRTPKIMSASYKQNQKSRELALLQINIVLASLFAYTAYEKLMDHERFMNGIARVGMIGRFALLISWSVPVAELTVAALLLIPKTARKGLWAFLGLMLIFSVYILTVLIWASKLPCHCGGVIETLSWTEHLIFNLGFIILSIIAIRLERTII